MTPEQLRARALIASRARRGRVRSLVVPPAPGEEWLALVDALRPRPA